jgi:hypothetical protein
MVICKQFNAKAAGEQRTLKQMRNKFKQLKMSAKKAVNELKHVPTGGGPRPVLSSAVTRLSEVYSGSPGFEGLPGGVEVLGQPSVNAQITKMQASDSNGVLMEQIEVDVTDFQPQELSNAVRSCAINSYTATALSSNSRPMARQTQHAATRAAAPVAISSLAQPCQRDGSYFTEPASDLSHNAEDGARKTSASYAAACSSSVWTVPKQGTITPIAGASSSRTTSSASSTAETNTAALQQRVLQKQLSLLDLQEKLIGQQSKESEVHMELLLMQKDYLLWKATCSGYEFQEHE